MALRNLLLVTYQFPPIGGSGVQRALKLAQYLPQVGWRAHVVSAGHTHYPLLDPTQRVGDGEELVVHRICGLEPAGVARTICRHLAQDGAAPEWLRGRPKYLVARSSRRCRPSGRGARATDVPGRSLTALEDRLYWRLDRVCEGLHLPEAEMLWIPAAIRQSRRLVERHGIEAVVTTSPPHSAHLVGLSLQRRLGLPWIADLRDPILDNFAYHPQTRLADRFWRWLEQAVVSNADHVVATCPELIDRLLDRHARLDANRFSTITNGFDPADRPKDGVGAVPDHAKSPSQGGGTGVLPVAQPAAPASGGGCGVRSRPRLTKSQRFTLAYVGAFYREQTIGPVLDAIRSLRANRGDIATDIEFRLIGSLSASQRRLLGADDAAFFKDMGYRSHEEAIREMAQADALLLVTPANDGGRLCIPAKAFEYLAFGGHILGLVHEGTALWRIMADAGNVTLLDCRVPGGLVPAIGRRYDAWRAGTPNGQRNQQVVERFRRDRLAARFARVVERCVDGVSRLRVVRDKAVCKGATA
ncbi:MAG: glycosyltransferase [Phycisphaerae bacterium]|nr:glycosyltransferase [Phycisphaerae bacterium]